MLEFRCPDQLFGGDQDGSGSDSVDLAQQVLLYRTTLLLWQTDSVLLAVVFVPFDYFFWQETKWSDPEGYTRPEIRFAQGLCPAPQELTL